MPFLEFIITDLLKKCAIDFTLNKKLILLNMLSPTVRYNAI